MSKVYVRIRPSDEEPTVQHSTQVLQVGEEETTFHFDKIFGQDVNQSEMYEATAQGLLKHVVDGYNATLLAYGQTGSGKTYTMLGPSGKQAREDRGIIPRVAEDLFARLGSHPDIAGFNVKVNYIEIFMEKIKDLTRPKNTNLRLRINDNSTSIVGINTLDVEDAESLGEIIRRGTNNRNVAATNMNAHSSRSHAVLILTINQTRKVDKIRGTQERFKSKFFLVDLAGSENAKRTGAQGVLLKQASSINTSLTSLATVIRAVTTNQGHIPYRDSKLTALLKNSLGGNAWMSLVICISAEKVNEHQTISSLRFGSTAKQMKNKPKLVLTMDKADWKKLAKSLEKELIIQKKTNEDLVKKLRRAKSENSVRMSPFNTPRTPRRTLRNARRSFSQVTYIDESDEEEDDEVPMVCAPDFVNLKDVPRPPQIVGEAPVETVPTLLQENDTLKDKLKEVLNQLLEKTTANQGLKLQVADLTELLIRHDENISQAMLDVAQPVNRVAAREENDFGLPVDTWSNILFWAGFIIILIAFAVHVYWNNLDRRIFAGILMFGILLTILGLAHVAS